MSRNQATPQRAAAIANIATLPASATQSDCSRTMARSWPTRTPSARSVAYSFSEAITAPRRVWPVTPTPTSRASSIEKPKEVPAPDSSSQNRADIQVSSSGVAMA